MSVPRQLEGVTYKFVHLMDMPNQNVLVVLDECLSFISDALDDDNCSVVVHWSVRMAVASNGEDE
jgi:hypothetical protein